MKSSEKSNLWIEEKLKIEEFYKNFFNRVIDWSLVILPIKFDFFKKIEYIFSDINEDQILKAYAKKFGEEKICKEWGSIKNIIKVQQLRPCKNYVFSHVGDIEADLLNKSYNDGILEGIKFMTPKEGFIATFRERTETGKMYDNFGATKLSALDSSGYALRMYRVINGDFGIDSSRCDKRNPSYGIRQIDFVF